MIRQTFLFLCLIVISFNTLAQDPQFSQFYAAPMYLNPGFTGITKSHRAGVNHRVQWPSVTQAFTTTLASYDLFDPATQSGYGVMAMRDKIGTGGLSLINIGLLYSYKIRISEKFVVSPGLYFGYGQMSIDRDKLVFTDGLNANSAPSLDPILDRLSNEQFFDFGSGVVAYNKNIWLGFSAYHINRPNQSLSEATDRLAVKYQLHGGMRLDLSRGVRTAIRRTYLTPSFVYRKQGSFQQMDFGLQYHIDPVVLGLWYRGIPFMKDFSQRSVQDALVFIFGFNLLNYQIGYSYDFSLSKLQTASGGSHEVSLIYEFELSARRKNVKRKYKTLPCPSFQKSPDFWAD